MNILSMTFIVGLLTATVRMMVPILLSALGETYSERAGILNIGLEGIMLISAFCAFLGSYYLTARRWGSCLERLPACLSAWSRHS